MNQAGTYFLAHTHLNDLIQIIKAQGFHCVGPRVRDGAICYDSLDHADQLPWGLRDHQSPGEYRLEKTTAHQAFGFANGPQAIKPILFKAQETVWRVERDQAGKLTFAAVHPEEPAVAILGVRSCDLHAMAIQDQHFMKKNYIDSRYQSRREKLLLVAVQCTYSSANCFCVSAGTGPLVTQPCDIVMTEIVDGFVVKAGSERGLSILEKLPLIEADRKVQQTAEQCVTMAARSQTKRIPLDNSKALRDVLFANLEHPRWEEVAERCLSCGNCTLVCPTCFCHSEKDEPSLDGATSEHVREWDSCFTAGHSFIAGKSLRDDTRKRYRQWLTHKVGSWFDQFDTSGCVGCGRCVTWCPVGIDITEELASITGDSNKREA